MENGAIREEWDGAGAVIPAYGFPRNGRRFNQGARSFQANPNKTKQKSFDFLGFIRPNRDFSMGYG
jgi:hypothetical protein